jgi:hypothetical protein
MPFVAELSEKRVIPEEVADGTDVMCPSCGKTMRPRGPFSDGTARHFYYLTDSGGCSGGESDTHRKWKSLAVSALRTRFDDRAAQIGPESPIDVSETASSVTERRVDALVRFENRHDLFGDGLAIEAQYRNESKDIEATTHDYLSNGVSVFWADADDFHQDQFLIEHLDEAFDNTSGVTSAFSAVHDTPPPVTKGEFGLDSSENSNSDWKRWTPIDPVPGCRHEFIRQESAQLCVRCGLEAETRIYDEHDERYVDPRMVLISRDPEFVADTHSVEDEYEPPEITEEGSPPQMHYHKWGSGSSSWDYDKYRCWCDAEMVVKEDKIFIDHKSSNQGDDCNHSWEVQGTTKVCTECGNERKPWDERN